MKRLTLSYIQAGMDRTSRKTRIRRLRGLGEGSPTRIPESSFLIALLWARAASHLPAGHISPARRGARAAPSRSQQPQPLQGGARHTSWTSLIHHV